MAHSKTLWGTKQNPMNIRKEVFVCWFLMKGTADKDRREIGMGEGESNQMHYTHYKIVKEQLIINI